MGKKYYCEYCDKRFKDDTSSRKRHIGGLPHQKARMEHYAHFKNPKEILDAELKKKPCSKFPNGTCQFGATCRFSHYTSEQLAKIRQRGKVSKAVDNLLCADLEEEKRLEELRPKRYTKTLIEDFVKKHRLEKEQSEQKFLKEFFNYPNDWLKIQHALPPSLRLIDPKNLKKDFQPNFFG